MLILPKRSKYGVGKAIGGCIYVHKKYADIVIPIHLLQKSEHIIDDFPYTILKYNLKTQSISFIEVLDFNINPEPVIGKILLIKWNPICLKIINPPFDPWIYHHKWLMVKDDYNGFNVDQSKQRSIKWMALYPDYSRIGKQSYWQNEIVSFL